MANVWATKNGNWSDTTLWNTGNLPAIIDDVYSNNFTVYVDNSYLVASVRNVSATSITAGGRFILNHNVSLSAFTVGGGANGIFCVQFLSAAPFFSTLVGDLCADNIAIPHPCAFINNSSGTATIIGNFIPSRNNGVNTTNGFIRNNSSGTLNLFGNYYGGLTNGIRGIYNASTGIINLSGSVFGIFSNTTSNGLDNASSGTVNVSGVVAARAGSVYGIRNASTGTINILGEVNSAEASGYGVVNDVTGTVNITGVVLGGAGGSSVGVYNTAGGLVRIVGNIQGGTGTSANGCVNNGAGTIAVSGTVIGSSRTQSVHGIFNNTGTISVTGTVIGGFQNGAFGISSTGTGSTTVLGTVRGGTSGPGINHAGTGVVTVSGLAIGGTTGAGVANTSTGTIIVSGSAIGGINSFGATNTSTGVLRVKRAVGNDWGLGYTTVLGGAPGVNGAQNSQTFVEELQCGPRGQWPTAGVIFFTPNTKATSMFETDTFQNYSLIQSNSADNLLPSASSVRQGEVYDLGEIVGSCIIPPTSSVAYGVLVDNTTGILTLTPNNTWNFALSGVTDDTSMGGRLKNSLNNQAVNSLINSFNL